MKRIIQFKKTDNGYACFDGETNIFEISIKDLQFNVKNFYQAFYSESMDYEDIEIENCQNDDKTACRIYDCIINLIEQIKIKMAELIESDGNKQEQK